MSTKNPFGRLVGDVAELRAIFPEPSKLVLNKVIDHIDVHVERFLALCSYMIIATSDADGRCDSSPRGGEPGFVHIIDRNHLLIPEVTGNRRNDSLLNILENPNIGIVGLIPGLDETIRINGRAVVTQDPSLLAHCVHANKIPLLGIGVEVQECYLHCGKAALRSTLWNPLNWHAVPELPNPAEILRDHCRGAEGDGSIEHMEEIMRDSYENRLY